MKPELEELEGRSLPSAMSGLTNALANVAENAKWHEHQPLAEMRIIDNISWHHTVWE